MKHTSLSVLGVLCLAVGYGGALTVGCGNSGAGHTTSSTSGATSSSTGTPVHVTPGGLCSLPGTVQFQGGATTTLPGGTGAEKLGFLKLPDGFCAHYYGQVPNARQIRFSPGGELFVASPTGGTTGGGPGGKAAIVILPDDNHDGLADDPIIFQSGLPETQGLMFVPGFLYYQDQTRIMRVPYAPGDRAPRATGQQIVDVNVYSSALHWPKTFDVADDGTIYVGNGGDQGETCDAAHPFHGGILKLDGSPNGAEVAKGLRNPINIRCSRGFNRCFALELAKDYSAGDHGREKMLPIRDGDDWGFPCCATQNLPYSDTPPGTACNTVVPDEVGFLIGDTPFALIFTPSNWPSAYANHALIGTHGAAGSWTGARIVSVAMDPMTGLPVPATDTAGQDSGSMKDFATGWDDGSLMHGRPAAFDFAPDGRLFIASDADGAIFWIAPLGT